MADTALLIAIKVGCTIRERLVEHVLTLSPDSLLWPRCSGRGVSEAVLAPGVLLASCGEKADVLKPSPSGSFPPWATWTKRCNISEFPAFGGLDTLRI